VVGTEECWSSRRRYDQFGIADTSGGRFGRLDWPHPCAAPRECFPEHVGERRGIGNHDTVQAGCFDVVCIHEEEGRLCHDGWLPSGTNQVAMCPCDGHHVDVEILGHGLDQAIGVDVIGERELEEHSFANPGDGTCPPGELALSRPGKGAAVQKDRISQRLRFRPHGHEPRVPAPVESCANALGW
jgi:hypothetical protein